MGREFELKYRADSGNIAAIRAAFGDFSEIRMETVYYDTLDAALSRRRWMLRRRYENGTTVCTLKTPLPDGKRPGGSLLCPVHPSGEADRSGTLHRRAGAG